MPFRSRFNHVDLPTPLNWFNSLDKWEIDYGSLIIYPGKTDFWQKIHYGFSFDNGHFLFCQTNTDFSLSMDVDFFPKHQYGQ